MCHARVEITAPRLICAGVTKSIFTTQTYSAYWWNTGANTRSIDITMPGRYSVIVLDAFGVTDSGFVDVGIGSPPKPYIGNSYEYICSGDIVVLRAQSNFARYLWNTGETTNEIKVSSGGAFSVSVEDSSGCVGTSDVTNIVVIQKPSPQINGVNAACRDALVVYNASNRSGETYTWFVDGGTVVSGQGTSTITVSWQRTGRIDLRISVNRPDGGTCDSLQSLFVRVGDKLQPELLTRKNSFCDGGSLTLQAADGFASYLWNTGVSGKSIVVTKPGSYWVTVTDGSGCSGASDTLRVRVWPKPNLSIKGPTGFCGTNTITLVAEAENDDVVFWEWNTGAKTRSIQTSAFGTYSVIGWTLDGCMDTTSIIVTPITNIGATATAVDFGTVPIAQPVTKLMRVQNLNNFDIIVTSFNHGRTDITATPLPPIPIPANSYVDFSLTWVPLNEGDMSATVEIVVSNGACTDTITSLIRGFVKPMPRNIFIDARIADTTLSVGSELSLPILLSVSDKLGLLQSVVMSVEWNNNVFRVDAITNATIVSDATLNGYRTVQLVIDYASSPTLVPSLIGRVLLTPPFNTPVRFLNLSGNANAEIAVNTENGSVTGSGCFLPGRLVLFSSKTISAVKIFTLDGRFVRSVPYSDYSNGLNLQLGRPHIMYFHDAKDDLVGVGLYSN